MRYEVELKPRAIRDLKALDRNAAKRIVGKLTAMQDNLAGDVKRLTNTTPEFRLRVGDYRVLFEIEGSKVLVYRIRHRRDAYS